MRCFQMLTAIAVLAGASAASADNLPPVPKTIPVTVSAIIIKEKVEPAPTPKVEAAPKVEQPSCSAEEAPLPPVPAKAEAVCDGKKCCRHPVEKAVVFLGNELLRKPIYDVQKALNDLEGRRLCREDRCLVAQAERLACRAAELAEKAKQTCPCDLHAKLRLLKEESEYAKKANTLAVKHAALECKEADHQQQTEKLKAKHAELFHCCD